MPPNLAVPYKVPLGPGVKADSGPTPVFPVKLARVEKVPLVVILNTVPAPLLPPA